MSVNAWCFSDPLSGPLDQFTVAIPRLSKAIQRNRAVDDRRRVSRACTACRNHKMKCSGGIPQCQRCASTGQACVYVMARKDRVKVLEERCKQMVELLYDLKTSEETAQNTRISNVLKEVEEELSSLPQRIGPVIAKRGAYKPRIQRGRGADPVIVPPAPLSEGLRSDTYAHAIDFIGDSPESQKSQTAASMAQLDASGTKPAIC